MCQGQQGCHPLPTELGLTLGEPQATSTDSIGPWTSAEHGAEPPRGLSWGGGPALQMEGHPHCGQDRPSRPSQAQAWLF